MIKIERQSATIIVNYFKIYDTALCFVKIVFRVNFVSLENVMKYCLNNVVINTITIYLNVTLLRVLFSLFVQIFFVKSKCEVSQKWIMMMKKEKVFFTAPFFQGRVFIDCLDLYFNFKIHNILYTYSWFHIKGTLSVHSFNGDHLSTNSAHR